MDWGTDRDDVKGKVVGPLEDVERAGSVVEIGVVGQGVELARQQSEVAADEGLELQHVLVGEGMRDGLALARVLCAVTRVEEPARNGYEGVIVLAAAQTWSQPALPPPSRGGRERWGGGGPRGGRGRTT